MYIAVCAARSLNKTINAERLLFLLPSRAILGAKSCEISWSDTALDSAFEIILEVSSTSPLIDFTNTGLLSFPSFFAPFPLFVFPVNLFSLGATASISRPGSRKIGVARCARDGWTSSRR